jgi:hypothetical protein
MEKERVIFVKRNLVRWKITESKGDLSGRNIGLRDGTQNGTESSWCNRVASDGSASGCEVNG